MFIIHSIVVLSSNALISGTSDRHRNAKMHGWTDQSHRLESSGSLWSFFLGERVASLTDCLDSVPNGNDSTYAYGKDLYVLRYVTHTLETLRRWLYVETRMRRSESSDIQAAAGSLRVCD